MKRPIDRQREAAVTLTIPNKEDGEIKAMLPIGGVLHVITERSIYADKLADAIDPDRTNRAIPNTQQRVLSYGAESELVGRTLLTAKVLFDSTFLPSTFDSERALIIVFEALTDLIAMKEIAVEYQMAEQVAIESVTKQDKKHGALTLPAIGNVSSRCKAFIQRADHVCSALFNLTGLFYKNVGGGFERLSKLFAKKYGADDPLTKFAAATAPSTTFIRETRNAIEHPRADQKCIVVDFALRSDGKIVAPTIEVQYRGRNYEAESISGLMGRINSELPEIFEAMMAYLCGKHVQSVAGIPVEVAVIPENQRVNKHVRFGYFGILNGGEPIHFG